MFLKARDSLRDFRYLLEHYYDHATSTWSWTYSTDTEEVFLPAFYLCRFVRYNKENNAPHDTEIDIILLTVTDLLLLYSHIFYRVGLCYFCGGSCSNGGKWNCTCLANVMLCHQLPPNRPCHQWLIPRPSPPWQPHFYSAECVCQKGFSEIGARGSDSPEPAPTRSPQIRLRDLINNFDFISNLLFNLFSLFLCLWRIDGFTSKRSHSLFYSHAGFRCCRTTLIKTET